MKSDSDSPGSKSFDVNLRLSIILARITLNCRRTELQVIILLVHANVWLMRLYASRNRTVCTTKRYKLLHYKVDNGIFIAIFMLCH